MVAAIMSLLTNHMLLLCVVAGLFTSCARRYRDYTIDASGGAPVFGSDHAIVSWNKSEGFLRASSKLRISDDPSLCEVAPGQHLVVYATQGYVLPLTANLVQYWTAVLALSSDLEVGRVTKLIWADYGSENVLRPGEVAVRTRQSFSGQGSPHPGSVAGSATILSRSAHHLRLRLELSITLGSNPIDGSRLERGLLKRDLEVTCQPIASRMVLGAYPRGATEEVGVPRLGPYKHKIVFAERMPFSPGTF